MTAESHGPLSNLPAPTPTPPPTKGGPSISSTNASPLDAGVTGRGPAGDQHGGPDDQKCRAVPPRQLDECTAGPPNATAENSVPAAGPEVVLPSAASPPSQPPASVARLRELIARTIASGASRPPSSATNFGQYVRQKTDAALEMSAGLLAMKAFLTLDPTADDELDQLKQESAATSRKCDFLAQEVSRLKNAITVPASAARKRSNHPGHHKPRRKKVTVKEAEAKLQAKENEIVARLVNENRSESERVSTLNEKLYSLSALDHALELGYTSSAAKTFSRTPRYKRWKPHRRRGSAARLDPQRRQSDTGRGGRSSKTGQTRDAGYARAHGLRVERPAKLEPLDATALRAIQADPSAAAWLAEHQHQLECETDSEQFGDNR